MTSVNKIIGNLVKDSNNPFKKTEAEIKKTLKELGISFEQINNDIVKLLENGIISLEKYAKLKQKGKSDKEIIKQIEDESKLLEKTI